MVLLLFLQLTIFVGGCFANELPSDFPRCSIKDPKVGNCIIRVANLLRPRFVEGINEIGIPSYDPLTFPRIDMKQESILMDYATTMKSYELDNFDITEIHYDPKTMTFNGKIQFDSVATNGHYNNSGRLLFIALGGNGTFQFNLDQVKVAFEITGDMSKHKNLDYYNPKNVKIRLNFGDMELSFKGLFDGNEQLGDMTNRLINMNSKMIVDAVAPALEVVVERFVMRYLKWLTSKYPYYELFTES